MSTHFRLKKLRRWAVAFSCVLATAGTSPGRHVVRSPGLTIEISPDGRIVGAAVGPKKLKRPLTGRTHLAGCTPRGKVAAKVLAGGGVEFTKTLVRGEDKRSLTLVERFRPTDSSIRWEIEITDPGACWTTPIETQLRYPAADTRFWTAWADPRNGRAAKWAKGQLLAKGVVPPAGVGDWADPLVPLPMDDLKLWYGAPHYRYDRPLIAYCPFRRDVICVPLATVLEPTGGVGLSLALSLEDLLLDLTLTTGSDGRVTFSRLFHRIGGGRTVRFAADLVAHEADWRGGLRWMAGRYKAFFDPPNPLAHEIAGTGAYSAHGTDFDADKLRRMAFAVNWKASFDFPYMGMFLPPVGDDVPWRRYGGGTATIRQMREYSRTMRQMGFHVLNYFNVTEFGARIQYPPPKRKAKADADLWKDPHDYVFGPLKDAILPVPPAEGGPKGLYGRTVAGQPYWTWGRGIVLDPGEPSYQKFLLDQARRHVEKLPDSSGICIDRMDWLRMYNHARDDGVSWFGGRPCRSMLWSWRDLMGKLGPLMHKAGKVIYCNNHVKRIEQLRHVDGLFDEFTYAGCPLNTVALMGVGKPVLGWTGNEKQLQPDADAFFQKYLYLGVFPMAPFPANDHSLRPSAWVDKQYLDYGPLLKAMRGKRWVLEPVVVAVARRAAKVNLFRVPGGLAMPVVFAGKAKSVRVDVEGLERVCGSVRFVAEARHPGADAPVSVPATHEGRRLILDVPVRRGCAMVRLGQIAIAGGPRRFVRSATVTIAAADNTAKIRYTLDGTEPGPKSRLYTQAVKLTATATVTARPFVDGGRGMSISATFTKVPLSAPRIGPAARGFTASAAVTLAAPPEAPGAEIRYTLDGTAPTADSRRYDAPIRMTESATVRARCFLPGAGPGAVASARFVKLPPPPPAPHVHISDLKAIKAVVGWGGQAKSDRSIQNNPLTIAKRRYAKGMGVHAASELVYPLKGEYKRFVAVVGVDDEMKPHAHLASIVFQVFVDGRGPTESPPLRVGDVWHFDVSLPAGAQRIRLVVTDAGDGIAADHADWANAGFLTK